MAQPIIGHLILTDAMLPHSSQRGCDNCEEMIGMAEDRGRVEDFTTSNFSGMVTVMDPSTSWVTKWTHQRNKVPGCYCLMINADPTDAVLEVAADKGIKLKSGAYE